MKRRLAGLYAAGMCAVVVVMMMSWVGCHEENKPNFNRVQFEVLTGKSSLVRGAVATATLKDPDGKILKQMVLKAATDGPWKNGTTHYGIFSLPHEMDYCGVGGVEIAFQPPANPTEGGTSWTMQSLTAVLSIDNVNQTALVNAAPTPAGEPAAELTASAPTFAAAVKCTPQGTLYSRLGGRPALEAVAEELVNQLQGDERLKKNFRATAEHPERMRVFKKHMADKLCHLSGGACTIDAKADRETLAGIITTVSEYRAFIDDVIAAMNKLPASVSVKDKNELLGSRLLSENGGPVIVRSKTPGVIKAATMTGANSGAIPSPFFVNLYWDSSWDADNANLGLKQQSVDAVIQAVTGSTYFAGLSEYGVKSGGFGGSFLPNASCTQKPGATVGFYDPVNPSLLGFLNCELQNENAIPQGDSLVYNIIMPQGTTEADSLADFLGFTSPDCSTKGASAVSWHFHGSPYSIASDIGGLLGGVVGGVLGGIVGWAINPLLVDFGAAAGAAAGTVAGLLLAMYLEDGPYWTISSTSTNCGNYTHDLLHEMVETATDATPPLSVLTSGGSGEIVDFCDDKNAQASSSWVPISTLPAGVTLNPGLFASLQVPQYWSNAGQVCTPGFSSTTMPAAPTVTMSGTFPVATIAITGSGFGGAAGTLVVPTSTNLPYIGIQDTTQGWQAGNSLNADTLDMTVSSWSDGAITISGFSPAAGSNLAMQVGDNLVVWVCNPASGDCNSTATTSTVGGSGLNPNDITTIGVTITTGDDDARPDSELWITVESQSPQCLKPSNNANSDSVCTNGGSAKDQNGRQHWENNTTDPNPQIFTVATPAPVLSFLNIQLISHNHLFETDDNWDIQAITITGTTRGGTTSTLFTQTEPMPSNSNNCIARLKGSPNATIVRFLLNGAGGPTYVDGKPAERGEPTSCTNNGD
jgi:hemoglobin